MGIVIMNNKYTTGIKKNILTRSFIYRLMVCFIIMFLFMDVLVKTLLLSKRQAQEISTPLKSCRPKDKI